ncbi:MAG TPA: Bax inhibitor-1 family protein [Kofleriaceae bacterium]|nr:Bax inhibitor-1 family protein [Kofleriaceae bacterium]
MSQDRGRTRDRACAFANRAKSSRKAGPSMAFAQSAVRRPIEGAVATLGVSDRVAFLRKTYGLLAIALVGFAVLTGGLMRYATEFSLKFSSWAFGGYTFLLVIALFIAVGFVSQRLAYSDSSRGLQLLGLSIAVAAEALLLQPMLWILMVRFGDPADLWAGGTVHATLSGHAASILMQAVVITLSIFIGLTAYVFITRKDFSFLRGVLTTVTFAVLGVIIASIVFGFSLGALFSGFVILLMAGYVLYQTSLVLSSFPPTRHVAAALMLFSTIATLFWYVLRLLMELNRR